MNITRTTFVNFTTGETSMGVLVFDDNICTYISGMPHSDMIKSDVDFLSEIIDNWSDDTFNDMIAVNDTISIDGEEYKLIHEDKITIIPVDK